MNNIARKKHLKSISQSMLIGSKSNAPTVNLLHVLKTVKNITHNSSK